MLLSLTLTLTSPPLAQAQNLYDKHQKISSTQGGFTGTLDNGDCFGVSVAALGDLDGDGVPEGDSPPSASSRQRSSKPLPIPAS